MPISKSLFSGAVLALALLSQATGAAVADSTGAGLPAALCAGHPVDVHEASAGKNRLQEPGEDGSEVGVFSFGEGGCAVPGLSLLPGESGLGPAGFPAPAGLGAGGPGVSPGFGAFSGGGFPGALPSGQRPADEATGFLTVTISTNTSSSWAGTSGADSVTVTGADTVMSGQMYLDAGDDTVDITGGATVSNTVRGQAGSDTLTITNSTLSGIFYGGSGGDTVTVTGVDSIVSGNVYLDANNDPSSDDDMTITGATVSGQIFFGDGSDDLVLAGGAKVTSGRVGFRNRTADTGANTIKGQGEFLAVYNNSTVNYMDFAGGGDTIGGATLAHDDSRLLIELELRLAGGNNTVRALSLGHQTLYNAPAVGAGGGNDRVETGGFIIGNVGLGGGNNVVIAEDLYGTYTGGAGADTVVLAPKDRGHLSAFSHNSLSLGAGVNFVGVGGGAGGAKPGRAVIRLASTDGTDDTLLLCNEGLDVSSATADLSTAPSCKTETGGNYAFNVTLHGSNWEKIAVKNEASTVRSELAISGEVTLKGAAGADEVADLEHFLLRANQAAGDKLTFDGKTEIKAPVFDSGGAMTGGALFQLDFDPAAGTSDSLVFNANSTAITTQSQTATIEIKPVSLLQGTGGAVVTIAEIHSDSAVDGVQIRTAGGQTISTGGALRLNGQDWTLSAGQAASNGNTPYQLTAGSYVTASFAGDFAISSSTAVNYLAAAEAAVDTFTVSGSGTVVSGNINFRKPVPDPQDVGSNPVFLDSQRDTLVVGGGAEVSGIVRFEGPAAKVSLASGSTVSGSIDFLRPVSITSRRSHIKNLHLDGPGEVSGTVRFSNSDFANPSHLTLTGGVVVSEAQIPGIEPSIVRLAGGSELKHLHFWTGLKLSGSGAVGKVTGIGPGAPGTAAGFANSTGESRIIINASGPMSVGPFDLKETGVFESQAKEILSNQIYAVGNPDGTLPGDPAGRQLALDFSGEATGHFNFVALCGWRQFTSNDPDVYLGIRTTVPACLQERSGYFQLYNQNNPGLRDNAFNVAIDASDNQNFKVVAVDTRSSGDYQSLLTVKGQLGLFASPALTLSGANYPNAVRLDNLRLVGNDETGDALIFHGLRNLFDDGPAPKARMANFGIDASFNLIQGSYTIKDPIMRGREAGTRGTLFELDVNLAAASLSSDLLDFRKTSFFKPATTGLLYNAASATAPVVLLKPGSDDWASGDGASVDIVKAHSGAGVTGVKILGGFSAMGGAIEMSGEWWALESATSGAVTTYSMERLSPASQSGSSNGTGGAEIALNVVGADWTGNWTGGAGGEIMVVNRGATVSNSTWALASGPTAIVGEGTIASTTTLNFGDFDDTVGNPEHGAPASHSMLTVGSALSLGGGDNAVRLGSVLGVTAGSGSDWIELTAFAHASAGFNLGDGDNTLMLGASAAATWSGTYGTTCSGGACTAGGGGADNVTIGANVAASGALHLGDGANLLTVESGGGFSGSLKGGANDDTVIFHAGKASAPTSVDLGAGTNKLFVAGRRGGTAGLETVTLSLKGGDATNTADTIELCAEFARGVCAGDPDAADYAYSVKLDASGAGDVTWETIKVNNQPSSQRSRLEIKGGVTLNAPVFRNIKVAGDASAAGDVITVTGSYYMTEASADGSSGTVFVLRAKTHGTLAQDKVVFDASAALATESSSAAAIMVSALAKNSGETDPAENSKLNLVEAASGSGITGVTIVGLTAGQITLNDLNWFLGSEVDSGTSVTTYFLEHIARGEHTIELPGNSSDAVAFAKRSNSLMVSGAGTWSGSLTGNTAGAATPINAMDIGEGSTASGTWTQLANGINYLTGAGTIQSAVTLGAAVDTIGIDPGGSDGDTGTAGDNPSQADINSNNSLTFSGALDLGGGDNMMWAKQAAAITAGAGDDTITLSGNATGAINLGGDAAANSLSSNTLAVGGTIGADVTSTATGTDTVSIGGGSGGVNLGGGTNRLTVASGSWSGSYTDGAGADTITISSGATISSSIDLSVGTTAALDDGTKLFDTLGGEGTLTGALTLGESDTVTGALTLGSVTAHLGGSVIHAAKADTITGGAGNDTVLITAKSDFAISQIDLGEGTNTLHLIGSAAPGQVTVDLTQTSETGTSAILICNHPDGGRCGRRTSSARTTLDVLLDARGAAGTGESKWDTVQISNSGNANGDYSIVTVKGSLTFHEPRMLNTHLRGHPETDDVITITGQFPGFAESGVNFPQRDFVELDVSIHGTSASSDKLAINTARHGGYNRLLRPVIKITPRPSGGQPRLSGEHDLHFLEYTSEEVEFIRIDGTDGSTVTVAAGTLVTDKEITLGGQRWLLMNNLVSTTANNVVTIAPPDGEPTKYFLRLFPEQNFVFDTTSLDLGESVTLQAGINTVTVTGVTWTGGISLASNPGNPDTTIKIGLGAAASGNWTANAGKVTITGQGSVSGLVTLGGGDDRIGIDPAGPDGNPDTAGDNPTSQQVTESNGLSFTSDIALGNGANKMWASSAAGIRGGTQSDRITVGTASGAIHLGGGADDVTDFVQIATLTSSGRITNGSSNGQVEIVIESSVAVGAQITPGNGDNTLRLLPAAQTLGGTYTGGAGVDRILSGGASLLGDIGLGAGDDWIGVDPGGADGDIATTGDNPSAGEITGSNGSVIGSATLPVTVDLGAGDDKVWISQMNGGTGASASEIRGGAGGDSIIASGSITGNLILAGGNNSARMSEAHGSVTAEGGNDTVSVGDGGGTATVSLGDGENSLSIGDTDSGTATWTGGYTGGADKDTVSLSGSVRVTGASVTLGAGANVVKGTGEIDAPVSAGDGNDTIGNFAPGARAVDNSLTFLKSVNLGGGANKIRARQIGTETAGEASVTTGGGQDLLALQPSEPHFLSPSLGDGDDRMMILGRAGGAGKITVDLTAPQNGGSDTLLICNGDWLSETACALSAQNENAFDVVLDASGSNGNQWEDIRISNASTLAQTALAIKGNITLKEAELGNFMLQSDGSAGDRLTFDGPVAIIDPASSGAVFQLDMSVTRVDSENQTVAMDRLEFLAAATMKAGVTGLTETPTVEIVAGGGAVAALNEQEVAIATMHASSGIKGIKVKGAAEETVDQSTQLQISLNGQDWRIGTRSSSQSDLLESRPDFEIVFLKALPVSGNRDITSRTYLQGYLIPPLDSTVRIILDPTVSIIEGGNWTGSLTSAASPDAAAPEHEIIIDPGMEASGDWTLLNQATRISRGDEGPGTGTGTARISGALTLGAGDDVIGGKTPWDAQRDTQSDIAMGEVALGAGDNTMSVTEATQITAGNGEDLVYLATRPGAIFNLQKLELGRGDNRVWVMGSQQTQRQADLSSVQVSLQGDGQRERNLLFVCSDSVAAVAEREDAAAARCGDDLRSDDYAFNVTLDAKSRTTGGPNDRPLGSNWKVSVHNETPSQRQSVLTVKGHVVLETAELNTLLLKSDGEAGDTLEIDGPTAILCPRRDCGGEKGTLFDEGVGTQFELDLGQATADVLTLGPRARHIPGQAGLAATASIRLKGVGYAQAGNTLTIARVHDDSEIKEIEIEGETAVGSQRRVKVIHQPWTLESSKQSGVTTYRIMAGPLEISGSGDADLRAGAYPKSSTVMGDWSGDYTGGEADDEITVLEDGRATGASWDLGGGDNVVKGEGLVEAALAFGGGNDTIGNFGPGAPESDNSLVVAGNVSLGQGENKMWIAGTGDGGQGISIDAGAGNDTIVMRSSAVGTGGAMDPGPASVESIDLGGGANKVFIIGSREIDGQEYLGHNEARLNLASRNAAQSAQLHICGEGFSAADEECRDDSAAADYAYKLALDATGGQAGWETIEIHNEASSRRSEIKISGDVTFGAARMENLIMAADGAPGDTVTFSGPIAVKLYEVSGTVLELDAALEEGPGADLGSDSLVFTEDSKNADGVADITSTPAIAIKAAQGARADYGDSFDLARVEPGSSVQGFWLLDAGLPGDLPETAYVNQQEWTLFCRLTASRQECGDDSDGESRTYYVTATSEPEKDVEILTTLAEHQSRGPVNATVRQAGTIDVWEGVYNGHLGAFTDNMQIEGGVTVGGTVDLQGGDDTITRHASRGTGLAMISGAVEMGAGNDVIGGECPGREILLGKEIVCGVRPGRSIGISITGTVDLGEGDNAVWAESISNETASHAITGGSGSDSIVVGKLNDNDRLNLGEAAVFTGNLTLGNGENSLTAGGLKGTYTGGADGDTVILGSAQQDTVLVMGDGGNSLEVMGDWKADESGSAGNPSYTGGSESDTVEVTGDLDAEINMGRGENSLTVEGDWICREGAGGGGCARAYVGGDNSDTIILKGSKSIKDPLGDMNLKGGQNKLIVTGGVVSNGERRSIMINLAADLGRPDDPQAPPAVNSLHICSDAASNGSCAGDGANHAYNITLDATGGNSWSMVKIGNRYSGEQSEINVLTSRGQPLALESPEFENTVISGDAKSTISISGTYKIRKLKKESEESDKVNEKSGTLFEIAVDPDAGGWTSDSIVFEAGARSASGADFTRTPVIRLNDTLSTTAGVPASGTTLDLVTLNGETDIEGVEILGLEEGENIRLMDDYIWRLEEREAGNQKVFALRFDDATPYDVRLTNDPVRLVHGINNVMIEGSWHGTILSPGTGKPDQRITMRGGGTASGVWTLDRGKSSITGQGTITARITLGAGDDAIGNFDIDAPETDNMLVIAAKEIALGDGNNSVRAIETRNIRGGLNNDRVELSKAAFGSIDLSEGDNRLMVRGSVNGDIKVGDGKDIIEISNSVSGTISLGGGAGDNTLTVGGEIVAAVTSQASGLDEVRIKGGSGSVSLGAGANSLEVEAGSWSGGYEGGDGSDTVKLMAGALITGALDMEGGENAVMGEGRVTGKISFGGGNDTIGDLKGAMTDNRIELGEVELGGGENEIRAASATSIIAGPDKDTIVLRPERSFRLGRVDLGAGQNTMFIVGQAGAPENRKASIRLTGNQSSNDTLRICNESFTATATASRCEDLDSLANASFSVELDASQSNNSWESIHVTNKPSVIQSQLTVKGAVEIKDSELGNLRFARDRNAGDQITLSGTYGVTGETVFELDINTERRTSDKLVFRNATAMGGAGFSKTAIVRVASATPGYLASQEARIEIAMVESSDLGDVQISGANADGVFVASGQFWKLGSESDSAGNKTYYIEPTGEVDLTALPPARVAPATITGQHILALSSSVAGRAVGMSQSKGRDLAQAGVSQSLENPRTGFFWTEVTAGTEKEQLTETIKTEYEHSFRFVNSTANLISQRIGQAEVTHFIVLQLGKIQSGAVLESSVTGVGYGVNLSGPSGGYFNLLGSSSRVSSEIATARGLEQVDQRGATLSIEGGWAAEIGSAGAVSGFARAITSGFGDMQLADGSKFSDFRKLSGELGLSMSYTAVQGTLGTDPVLSFFGGASVSSDLESTFKVQQLNTVGTFDTTKSWVHFNAGMSWGAQNSRFYTEVSTASPNQDFIGSKRSLSLGYDVRW